MNDSATESGSTPVFAVAGVHKRYGGVRALAGVDLEIYPGRVHAIVGENGAGKSTLMKILVGAEQPDAGTIFVKGEPVTISSLGEANARGIAIVFQEQSLFPDLDVLTNLFLLRAPRRLGLIARKEMTTRATPVLKGIGLDVSPDARVLSLSVGQRQMVEIARALLEASAVIILDEPNSALNATESERFFRLVRQLPSRGLAVVFVSHRLEEVFRIADVITVMRNGKVVQTVEREETSISGIVAAMLGHNPRERPALNERIARHDRGLMLERVTVDKKIHDVSLEASPGEILGLAGLEGAGVQTVFEVVFGAYKAESGSIRLPSGRLAPRDIAAAVRSGIAYVPADRQRAALMLEQTVLANVSQVTTSVLRSFGLVLRAHKIRERVAARSEALRIRMASMDSPVNQLSGGNQQKVVLAKWLETDPSVVLLDDPTRGVDVGAKTEIYEIIQKLAREGRIVLLSSSELPEYVQLCDRVIVFFKGSVCGELDRELLSEHRLLEAINTGRVTPRDGARGLEAGEIPPQSHRAGGR